MVDSSEQNNAKFVSYRNSNKKQKLFGFITKQSLFFFGMIFVLYTFFSNQSFALGKYDKQYKINLVRSSKTEIPRCRHFLTQLGNGNVVITGNVPLVERGENDSNIRQVEIYNLKTNKTKKAGFMNLPSCMHNAILLKDGRVLILGGDKMPSADYDIDKRIQIYNPQSNDCETIVTEFSLSSRPICLLENGNVFIKIQDDGHKKKYYYCIFNPNNNSLNKYPSPESITSVLKCGEDTIVITRSYSFSRKNINDEFYCTPCVFKIYKYNTKENNFIFLEKIEHPFSTYLKAFSLNDNEIVICLSRYEKHRQKIWYEYPTNILTFNTKTKQTKKVGGTISDPLNNILITREQEILLFHTKEIEIYDIKTNTSSIIKKPYFLNTYSYGSQGETIVLNDGNILTIGGYSPWEGYLKNIYVYNLKKRNLK